MSGPTRVSSAPHVSLSGCSDAPCASVSLRVRAVLWCIARGADERPSVPKCLSERVCGHARGSDRGSFGVAVGDEKRRRHVRLCGCGPQPSLPTTIERLSYDDAQPLQLGGSELGARAGCSQLPPGLDPRLRPGQRRPGCAVARLWPARLRPACLRPARLWSGCLHDPAQAVDRRAAPGVLRRNLRYPQLLPGLYRQGCHPADPVRDRHRYARHGHLGLR